MQSPNCQHEKPMHSPPEEAGDFKHLADQADLSSEIRCNFDSNSKKSPDGIEEGGAFA
jgi:hypothetical protein